MQSLEAPPPDILFRRRIKLARSARECWHAREVILSSSYAARKDLAIGDHVKLDGKRFEVIGVASPPLGGQASDMYLKLGQLQALADREGRVNNIYVRADFLSVTWGKKGNRTLFA